jgi:hypothetical protein
MKPFANAAWSTAPLRAFSEALIGLRPFRRSFQWRRSEEGEVSASGRVGKRLDQIMVDEATLRQGQHRSTRVQRSDEGARLAPRFATKDVRGRLTRSPDSSMVQVIVLLVRFSLSI